MSSAFSIRSACGSKLGRAVATLATVSLLATSASLVPASAGAAAPKPTASSSLVGVVNINTATPEQLQLLPSIGPSRATSIVAHRREHGPFARVDDLMLVSGIGEAALERLRPHLVVKGKTTAQMP